MIQKRQKRCIRVSQNIIAILEFSSHVNKIADASDLSKSKNHNFISRDSVVYWKIRGFTN